MEYLKVKAVTIGILVAVTLFGCISSLFITESDRREYREWLASDDGSTLGENVLVGEFKAKNLLWGHSPQGFLLYSINKRMRHSF